MLTKLPPIEKVYEAYSALADDRVRIKEHTAEVDSSDRTKHYTVAWDDTSYTSDDNATYWAGYPGYPVLAVLMKQGLLPCNSKIIPLLADVDWKQLNTAYKRNYAKAAAFLFESRSLDADYLRQDAEQVLDELRCLDITVSRGRRRSADKK